MTQQIHIESAVELSEKQKSGVLDLVKTTFPHSEVTFSLDDRLLGGLRMTVNGSEQYDASVLGKLRALQTNVR